MTEGITSPLEFDNGSEISRERCGEGLCEFSFGIRKGEVKCSAKFALMMMSAVINYIRKTEI